MVSKTSKVENESSKADIENFLAENNENDGHIYADDGAVPQANGGNLPQLNQSINLYLAY